MLLSQSRHARGAVGRNPLFSSKSKYHTDQLNRDDVSILRTCFVATYRSLECFSQDRLDHDCRIEPSIYTATVYSSRSSQRSYHLDLLAPDHLGVLHISLMLYAGACSTTGCRSARNTWPVGACVATFSPARPTELKCLLGTSRLFASLRPLFFLSLPTTPRVAFTKHKSDDSNGSQEDTSAPILSRLHHCQ